MVKSKQNKKEWKSVPHKTQCLKNLQLDFAHSRILHGDAAARTGTSNSSDLLLAPNLNLT